MRRAEGAVLAPDEGELVIECRATDGAGALIPARWTDLPLAANGTRSKSHKAAAAASALNSTQEQGLLGTIAE